MNKPFIVAEISANHGGTIGRAFDIIKAAAAAGADAVKFQLYDPDKMAPADMVIAEGPWAGRNARELYREAMTPREWFPQLFEMASFHGIEAFSSVFDAEGLDYLESINCPRYKIASFEIGDLDLLRAVGRTGKPVLISTGMASREDIQLAVLAALPSEHTLLKCTSAYPATYADANLATMRSWLDRGIQAGLSDHTLGSTVAIAATALGAAVIEKHLTLSRDDGGPDAAFSMEPPEFAAMVSGCRLAAEALGTVRYGATLAERPQLQLKGRTMAARSSDVPRGTT